MHNHSINRKNEYIYIKFITYCTLGTIPESDGGITGFGNWGIESNGAVLLFPKR